MAKFTIDKQKPTFAIAPGSAAASATGGPDLSLSFGKGPPRGTSAPASPAKSRESLLQRVQSLTGAARDQGASILGNLKVLKNIMSPMAAFVTYR